MKVVVALLCIVATVYTNTTTISPSASESEEEIWSHILDEWMLPYNYRTGRLIQVSSSKEDSRNATLDDNEKEGKIFNGFNRITNGNPLPNKPQSAPAIRETDLYLLGAMEKLVYRMDTMEKRVKKLEEMLYFVVAGNRVDQDPCPDNLTRIGAQCYYIASNGDEMMDWKIASRVCKRHKATLAELESIEENQDLIEYLQRQKHLRGKDFWIGGLNPGLLWIWSNSARPVKVPGFNNKKSSSAIQGEGRCLCLSYNQNLKNYVYYGTNCSMKFNFICESTDNIVHNELVRIARNRNIIS